MGTPPRLILTATLHQFLALKAESHETFITVGIQCAKVKEEEQGRCLCVRKHRNGVLGLRWNLMIIKAVHLYVQYPL